MCALPGPLFESFSRPIIIKHGSIARIGTLYITWNFGRGLFVLDKHLGQLLGLFGKSSTIVRAAASICVRFCFMQSAVVSLSKISEIYEAHKYPPIEPDAFNADFETNERRWIEYRQGRRDEETVASEHSPAVGSNLQNGIRSRPSKRRVKFSKYIRSPTREIEFV